ncbi:MAG: hypothetical protein ACRC41_05085 [Sarcina sp.]
MLYRIYGNMNFWIWTDLKDEIKGIAKDYKLDENKKIIYKEFEVAKAIQNKKEIETIYNVRIEEVV